MLGSPWPGWSSSPGRSPKWQRPYGLGPSSGWPCWFGPMRGGLREQCRERGRQQAWSNSSCPSHLLPRGSVLGLALAGLGLSLHSVLAPDLMPCRGHVIRQNGDDRWNGRSRMAGVAGIADTVAVAGVAVSSCPHRRFPGAPCGPWPGDGSRFPARGACLLLVLLFSACCRGALPLRMSPSGVHRSYRVVLAASPCAMSTWPGPGFPWPPWWTVRDSASLAHHSDTGAGGLDPPACAAVPSRVL